MNFVNHTIYQDKSFISEIWHKWTMCMKNRFLWIWILLLGWIASSYAQKSISIHSENNQIIDATLLPATQYLNGEVKIYHANTFMYCDTAILRGNILKMRHNVAMLQNDTIRIFSDSLRYDGDSLVAYLYGNVILENGPTKKLFTTYLKYDVKNKIAYYNRNARLEDQLSSIVSKRGKYVLKEKQAYFYEYVKVSGEHFELKSDSLVYNTAEQKVKFIAPVEIHKDSSQIYSQSGWFDMDDENGEFIGNAQYIEVEKYATSDTIRYNGTIKKIELIAKNEGKLSKYITNNDTAFARIIVYNETTEEYTLKEHGYYKSKSNEVNGDKITFNKKTEKFNVTGRSEIRDGATHIKADTLDYDKTQKIGIALGNVIWKDTSAQSTMYADHITFNEAENDMKVFNYQNRPLIAFNMDGDSLYMKADTFRSHRVIKERILYPDKRRNQSQKSIRDRNNLETDSITLIPIPVLKDSMSVTKDSLNVSFQSDTIFTGIMDTLDYFIGDGLVRIFKSDMQAVCDSIVFSKTDSVFTLYEAPFMWSDSTQIAGDTISMFVKGGKMKSVKVRQHGTILKTDDLLFYDQIQGREIDAGFLDGVLHDVFVDGNARLVYYMKDDDKAYIGVNTTESSTMRFIFKDKQLTDFKAYTEPNSRVHPMQKANHNDLRIEGFIWKFDVKPYSKDSL